MFSHDGKASPTSTFRTNYTNSGYTTWQVGPLYSHDDVDRFFPNSENALVITHDTPTFRCQCGFKLQPQLSRICAKKP